MTRVKRDTMTYNVARYYGRAGGGMRDVRYFAIYETFVGEYARTNKPRVGTRRGMPQRVIGHLRIDCGNPRRISVKAYYHSKPKKARKP